MADLSTSGTWLDHVRNRRHNRYYYGDDDWDHRVSVTIPSAPTCRVGRKQASQ
jgi:hypothetical protein